MCGATAESIVLALSIAKTGDATKVMNDYAGSGGRGRVERLLIGSQDKYVQDDFNRYVDLLKYWRDSAAFFADQLSAIYQALRPAGSRPATRRSGSASPTPPHWRPQAVPRSLLQLRSAVAPVAGRSVDETSGLAGGEHLLASLARRTSTAGGLDLRPLLEGCQRYRPKPPC